jgi:hypothetical protein
MANKSTDKLTDPLSYIDWLQQGNIDTTVESDLFVQYSNYVRNFYQSSNAEKSSNRQSVADIYKALLKDITLRYSTVDEQRFLSNINYDDPAELDIIIPYFAKKLKQVTQYLVTKRQDVQFSKIKSSFKGSELGVKKAITDTIYALLGDKDFTQKYPRTQIPTVSAAIENVTISVNTLYDTYQNYFDLDPSTDKTTYCQGVSSGYHYDQFGSNVNPVSELAFIDIQSAITSLFEELPQILTTACSDDVTSSLNLDLLINIPRSNISELPYNYFVDATKTLDNLILQYDKKLSEKYAGTSTYYLSTDSTATYYVSGLLYEASNSSANILNRYFPSVASVPNTNNLSDLKDIGGFFIPTKLGILNYSAPVFTYKLDTANLLPNTLYVFPDPDQYGAGRGNTKTDQSSPYKHTDDISPIKTGTGNGEQAGDITNASKIQKMWPYQSTEESLQLHSTGVSRSTDNIDFWTGDAKDVWSNSDIYPILAQQDLPVQSKLDDLLISDNTLYQWRTDIYGNEYGLYKALHPSRTTTNQTAGNYTTAATQSTDTTLASGLSSLLNKQNVNYFDFQASAHTTEYSSTPSPVSNETTAYDKHDQYGNWYVRNSMSTVIGPVSSALSGVFVKYTQLTDVMSEINYKIKNFDIIKDVVIIETDNFLIFEKIKYNAETEVYTSDIGQRLYISLSGSNRALENFSNIWYNDVEDVIYVATLLVHPYLSGSNYKAIYPRVYEYDIAKKDLRDIYSLATLTTATDISTTFDTLCTAGYSLYGTTQQINITSAARPNICFNRLDKKFLISYTGQDPANKVYTAVTYLDTKTGKTFDTSVIRMFKPVNSISNYHIDNFTATSNQPSISADIEGILNRTNTSETHRFSVDGLVSEIDTFGPIKQIVYGSATEPSLSGRPVNPVTRHIDTASGNFLLGHDIQQKIASTGELPTYVDNSPALPYTHNSSYVIDNTGLDPLVQDIEAYIDVAFYTLTDGNSAYTHTLNTTESAFEALPTKYSGTRAPGGGLSIFLFDTSYEFYPAGIGSALGYTNYTGAMGDNYSFTADVNGIRGGYIGVGFDIEGNFGNSTDSKTGTTGITAYDPGHGSFPYIGTVGTCPDTTVSPNTLTLRSSEISSYRVLTTTSNLSNYPVVSDEEYDASPAVTLHEYVSSRDDITFHKLKVALQNGGKRVKAEILDATTGKFYPYMTYDLTSIPPTSLRVGVSFATSDRFTNCEIKTFNVYGTAKEYFKDRTVSKFEPLSSAAFSVSAHSNFC